MIRQKIRLFSGLDDGSIGTRALTIGEMGTGDSVVDSSEQHPEAAILKRTDEAVYQMVWLGENFDWGRFLANYKRQGSSPGLSMEADGITFNRAIELIGHYWGRTPRG